MAGNNLTSQTKLAKPPRTSTSHSNSASTLRFTLGKLSLLLFPVYSAYLLLLLGLPTSTLLAACPSPVYAKCPRGNSDEVGVHYVNPWHLLVDTVVERGESSDYIYHWCLKATPPTEPGKEFEIDWQDWPIDWNQKTTCGGWAGMRTASSLEPSDWTPTTIYVGSNRTRIRPVVKKPAFDEALLIPDDEHEYRTEILVALPTKKGASELGNMKLTMVSSFSRSEDDPKLVNYQFEYEDEIGEGPSFARFMFDPKSVSQIKELEGIFRPRKEKQRIPFGSFQPPANVFSTITFLDDAGEMIGRAPVSLALPLKE